MYQLVWVFALCDDSVEADNAVWPGGWVDIHHSWGGVDVQEFRGTQSLWRSWTGVTLSPGAASTTCWVYSPHLDSQHSATHEIRYIYIYTLYVCVCVCVCVSVSVSVSVCVCVCVCVYKNDKLENKLDRSIVHSEESLWLELQKAWDNTSVTVLRKCIDTMPERCASAIAANIPNIKVKSC